MTKQQPDIVRGTVRIKHPKMFETVDGALAEIQRLYDESVATLRAAFDGLVAGDLSLAQPESACYPYVGIEIDLSDLGANDAGYAYGMVDAPGFYGTTLTRPDLFYSYYYEQISLLLERYRKPIIVGLSEWRIPLPFVVDYSKLSLTPSQIDQMKVRFEQPNLTRLNDRIVNHTYKTHPADPKPLALFSGERVDFSLHRLHHYTGTSPEHFQNFILLTNYQRYVDSFVQYGVEQLKGREGYTDLIQPGDLSAAAGPVQTILPQMPAYHLKRPDRNGITFINIGIGPTNAKNITDHLAVLRPHCWVMLGHCAGLKRTQYLGDYVLAHGYVREDGVLDNDLPLWVPIPPIAEVQVALQDAVCHVTRLQGAESKRRMRTGTVYTTDDRNWELRSYEMYERFNQSRAVAVDMESATIAANGLRFRVPYGTLLCVSDKPIHGEIKLRGMANSFYSERINQHLVVGLDAVRILRERGIDSLHSRKLRGFDEPAFR